MGFTTVLQNSMKTPLKLIVSRDHCIKNDPHGGRFNAKTMVELFYLKIHFHGDTCRLPPARSIECSTPRIGLARVVT
jgi:hypothetical protein